MKRAVLITLALFTLASCAIHSRTSIGPQRAFELGAGLHGPFKAAVKNDSGTNLDLYEMKLGYPAKKLLTLEPGQKKTVRFGADTKAIFKNNTNNEAAVILKVTGDTGLTMGGTVY